jgi:hypothetical protein
MFILRAVFCLCLAADPPVEAESAVTKPAARESRSVEVQFVDRSSVRVWVLDQTVEISTRYGKLTVPAAEIRRIDFATVGPGELAKRVEAAIHRLGAEAYKEREAASKELVALGASAIEALQVAKKSKDAEVANRANEALRQIQSRVSADDPLPSDKDRIQTNEFTIAGRITSATIKVKTNYFGQIELKLSDLRRIRSLSPGGDFDIAVDAAQFGSDDSQWLRTTITVEADDQLAIVASGRVDLWDGSGQYACGPAGYGDSGGWWGRGASTAPRPGSLVGRIGSDGPTFVIGERYRGAATRSGTLHLHIVPSPWNTQSSGTYQVKIHVGSD